MPLVALDSNLVDLLAAACETPEHVERAEAMEPPPPFTELPPQLAAEAFACFWLLAMAPAWRSVVYTFSDLLYDEIGDAPRWKDLPRVAYDVLVRDEQMPEHRTPDPYQRPDIAGLRDLGVGEADAVHVADTIGMRCTHLLTNDRQLRNRSHDIEARWPLTLRRPSEFLVESVRAGAPWTSRAPWPWESLGAIVGDRAAG